MYGVVYLEKSYAQTYALKTIDCEESTAVIIM